MVLKAILIGSITGFVSAFFGIGGSSIDTPILRVFLDLPPLISLGTPLAVSVLTSTIAFITYERQHLVNFRIAFFSLLGGLPGMVSGSLFSTYFSGKFLMLLTAVVLGIVGLDITLKNLLEGRATKKNSTTPPAPLIVVLAAAVGLLSGILANGGGIFLVPTYTLIFRMKIKEAIATSLPVVAVLALPGAVIHYSLGHIDLRIAAAMAVGVVPLAYVGAKLDIKTKSKTIMTLFGLLMLIFSVYFFINQLKA